MWPVVLLAALLVPRPPLPPPGEAWQRVKEEAGVLVRTAPSGIAAPWGSAEGDIDAPPARVLAHLTDFAAQVRYVPKLKESRVIRRDASSAIVYFYFDLPWPISDRDYTVRYRWAARPDGAIEILVDDDNADGPPAGSAVRVSLVRGDWLLTPLPGGRTHVRYDWLADFGGSLTRGIVEQTAWKQPLETVLGIRKALAK